MAFVIKKSDFQNEKILNRNYYVCVCVCNQLTGNQPVKSFFVFDFVHEH